MSPTADQTWPERRIAAVAAGLAILTAIGLGGWVWDLESAIRAPSDGEVDIVGADFGANCGAQKNNMLQWVASACAGKSECDFAYNWRIGNPVATCNSQFQVRWRCSRHGHIYDYTSPSRPSDGTIIPISCARQLSTAPPGSSWKAS